MNCKKEKMPTAATVSNLEEKSCEKDSLTIIPQDEKDFFDGLREECRTNSYLRKLSEAEERRRENVIYGFAPDERLCVEEALEEIRLDHVSQSMQYWAGNIGAMDKY